MQELHYVPLLPSLSSITFLDLLLPPLAIALSLFLHTLFNTPVPPTTQAHIYRARTAHARFVPRVAKHLFSYPVLYFGIDLDALEQRKLDIGNRCFAWRPSRWTLTALRPEAYLDPTSSVGSIKQKLLEHLGKHGVPECDTQKVYTVTMPAYLGLEGINPLTTHFVYDQGRTRMTAVVLEVHNTFGERHLYVLPTGIDEDPKVAIGFEHQWTFPRAFHVSPFNDRSGFYRVSLIDPLSVSKTAPDHEHLRLHPKVAIRIVFLTPDYEKKIYATLNGSGEPLTQSSLLSALLRWPLSLLLTTPRILWQALKLHYAKKLDVFPRPEPFVKIDERDGNPVEAGGRAGSVGWQGLGGTELFALAQVVRFLHARVEGTDLQVILQPADSSQPTLTFTSGPRSPTTSTPRTLEIHYLTPLFFTDLLTSPTPSLALALGSHLERRWSTSDHVLFAEVFTPLQTSSSHWSRLARSVRRRQVLWSLSFSPSPSPSPTSPPSTVSLSDVIRDSPPHLLDRYTGPALVYHLLSHAFSVRLAYWIFQLTRARFVSGTEGWSEWARLAESMEGRVRERPRREFGSVLHR